jgi:hypothetical protein
MGESNAYGMCATDPQNEWVQVVAGLIRRHQDGYLRVFNNSIPANVVSPAAPGYVPFSGAYAMAPAAIERFERDMLSKQPDAAIYAYGLNDARCGHAAQSFLEDYEAIIARTRDELPDSLIVLVGPYWNPQFEQELWDQARFDGARFIYGAFAIGGDALVLEYASGISVLASRYGALFVNVYTQLRGAMWLIHPDACHYTDVGQNVLGNMVFMAMAANCSFLSRKSQTAVEQGGFDTRDTGGTNGLPTVVNTWRYLEEGQTPWLRGPE